MFDWQTVRETLGREAAALAVLPTGQMGLEDWAELVSRSRELINAAAAVQAVAIARAAAFEEQDLEDGTVEVTERPIGHVALDGPSVVAGRLGCTEQTAAQRVDESITLVRDLPEVHRAMAEGRVDAYQAKRIAMELVEAPAEVRRAVSAAIEPWLGRESAPRLAERTRRILGRIDADLLRQRAARARAERGLFREFAEPGMEQWRMFLPAETAGPLWAAIDHEAQERLRAGLAETIGQSRLDALVEMATSGLSGTIDLVLVHPAAEGTGDAAGAESAAGTASRRTTGTGGRAADQRTGAAREAAAATAAALARHLDGQTEIGGLAPWPTAVPNAWLRDLILGATCSGGRGALDRGSSAPTGRLGSGPRVRIRLAWCHSRTGALGQPLDSGAPLDRDGYRPSPRTIAFVKARDRRCRFPDCQIAARFCDVDHVRPWPGGPTSPDNLICLCRRHHRIKQRRRWRVHLDDDGRAHWIDPTGVERVTAPVDLTGVTLGDLTEVRAPRPAEHPIDPAAAREAAERRAREDGASLLEDLLTHELIRAGGEVPQWLADGVPERDGIRRRRLLDKSAACLDRPVARRSRCQITWSRLEFDPSA